MKITVRVPWWSAYKKFSWADKVWGAGVQAMRLESAAKKNERVKLTVASVRKTYDFNAQDALDMCQELEYITHVGNGTKLYVIPSTYLEQYESK